MVSRTMLEVLGHVVLCSALGRLLFVLARSRPDALAYAGMPLLGGLALGLQLWGFGVAHIPWNRLTLLVPWVLAGAIVRRPLLQVLRSDYDRARAALTALGRLDWLRCILLAMVLLLGFTYLLSLVTQPIFAWDTLVIWGIKAKIFANRQAVDLTGIADEFKQHLDYPPLFPLITASFYVLIGRVDDIAGKAVSFLFLPAAAGAIYAVLREIAADLAIPFLFLVVALPIFQPFLLKGVYMGYADYALGVCILLSLANLHASATRGAWAASLMAVVFASMAALIKNEGLPLLGLVLVVVAVRTLRQARKEGRQSISVGHVAWMLASVVPVVAWQLWARAHGFDSDIVSDRDLAPLLLQLPARQGIIDDFIKTMPARANDYGWLAAALLLSLVLLSVNRLRYGSAVLAVILAQLAVYDLVFLFTPHDLSWHLGHAMDRVAVQMTPALILLLGVSLAPYLESRSG